MKRCYLKYKIYEDYNYGSKYAYLKLKKMAREERNTIGYTVALISEFAHHFGISSRQAYTYLKRFKGMEHLYNHYVVLHTQSFPDTIDALAQVCTNNGGELK